MVKVEETTQGVLDKISEGFAQKGAFNLRQNGISICHGDSEHIKIKKKEDKSGIDIFIDGETKGEKVFIPVVVSVSGCCHRSESGWPRRYPRGGRPVRPLLQGHHPRSDHRRV